MAIKLSIFTTMTSPYERGDNYEDALNCYKELADEVVVIDGSGNYRDGHVNKKHGPIFIAHRWPREFDWTFIGEQFQRGYEACTGDWVIHADLDFIFHEKDFMAIREVLSNSDAPAMSFYKRQFILPDRFNLKSRLVVAVNKGKFGDRIAFNSGGDLAQPSLDNVYLSPDDVPEAKIPMYNYEKMIKTEPQIIEDVGRMARAWQRTYGEYKLGGPDYKSAYKEWLDMVIGRFHKPSERIKLEDHPKFVIETIKKLKPEQFGYSGFGKLEVNDYV